ncbi:hypothetical protein IQ07DRAFT_24705 [Pyrenochaeta sp. DS3sAY3a]|nr:hypothetical protein IQ07DRAFT_24705 [Pyrenochaeta sp. DS3sAY3a]
MGDKRLSAGHWHSPAAGVTPCAVENKVCTRLSPPRKAFNLAEGPRPHLPARYLPKPSIVLAAFRGGAKTRYPLGCRTAPALRCQSADIKIRCWSTPSALLPHPTPASCLCRSQQSVSVRLCLTKDCRSTNRQARVPQQPDCAVPSAPSQPSWPPLPQAAESLAIASYIIFARYPSRISLPYALALLTRLQASTLIIPLWSFSFSSPCLFYNTRVPLWVPTCSLTRQHAPPTSRLPPHSTLPPQHFDTHHQALPGRQLALHLLHCLRLPLQ